MILTPRTRDLFFLAAVCGLCFFAGLGAVGIFDVNEGLYVQAAREMYLRGDYITPHLNGGFFFDKPPLALWLTVISFHVFGVTEFAARFPVALAASCLVLVTYWFGARHFSRLAGLIAACMLALGPLFLISARQMTMDIHQTLWFAVAMICFYTAHANRSQVPEENPPLSASPRLSVSPLRWYLGFWAACGMAFMAKSVPGLFPIAAALVFICWDEKFQIRAIFRRIREARPTLGILILLAVILPWHLLAYRANGQEFLDQYWYLHHIKLLNGTDFNHVQPLYYYFLWLLIGFFPWSLFLFWAIPSAWQRAKNWGRGAAETRGKVNASHRFVLAWALTVFVIFAVMKSKLLTYLLPMYPATALLAGDWMAREVEERRRALPAAITVLSVLSIGGLLAAGSALGRMQRDPLNATREYPYASLAWAIHAFIAFGVSMILVAILMWAGRRRVALATMGAACVAALIIGIVEGLPAVERNALGPLHEMARAAGERMTAGDRLAIHIASPTKPSVYFYLPAHAILDTSSPDPNRQPILDEGNASKIHEFLATNRPAVVLTDLKRADTLRAADPDLNTQSQAGRWILLRAKQPDRVHALESRHTDQRRKL